MSKTITATKDGRTRQFNPITWDLLGANNAGWEQVKTAKKPTEVKDSAATKEEVDKKATKKEDK